MKTKIVLFGLAVLLFGNSNLSAQWYIGGALSVNGDNQDGKTENQTGQNSSKHSYLYLSPKVGYFLSDNFMVGLGLNVGSQKSDQKNYSQTINGIDSYYKFESNSKLFSIEPYVRYYIPFTEKISFMNHVGLSYGFINTYSANYDDNNTYKNYADGKGNEIVVEYYPGISLNITEKLLVEVGVGAIGFSHYKIESTPKTEYTGSSVVDEGDMETNKSNSYYLEYNNVRLGLAFKF